MTLERLTTERILAEFQCVIKSNQEFRLNDTVDVIVIHVSMTTGGKGCKRSEVNLEHLEKKKNRSSVSKTMMIYVRQELSWLPRLNLMIVATVKYEIIGDHFKCVWRRNSTKTPAYLSVRVDLSKPRVAIVVAGKKSRHLGDHVSDCCACTSRSSCLFLAQRK